MKVLLALESAEVFYSYKSVIHALCAAGHRVRVFFSKGVDHRMRPENTMELVDEFKNKFSGFEYSRSVYRPDFWRRILAVERAVANYRRFVLLRDRPDFYRDRYKKFLPFFLKPLVWSKSVNVNFIVRTPSVGRLLTFIENWPRPDKFVVANIKEYEPDIVLVSSGNVLSSSSDFEYLRAAKAMNVPGVLLVASWDYLETKGLLHIIPDRLLVWNESHAKEAVASHGVPPERIRLVGAPLFDDFFRTLRPSQSRQEFCAQLGLRAEDPILLYIGSSGIFGDESRFIRSIRKALDESPDQRLRNVQLAVRPHPSNRRSFKKMIKGLKDVIAAPTLGEMPITKEALQFFYDTLYYALAATGIGSSGFINALIVGKPSVTVLSDDYHHIQAEAPHFKHLVESGAIKSLSNFAELPDFLKGILEGRDETFRERNLFIRNYVRPRGLDRSAGEIILKELENLASWQNTLGT